ncbi:MAG: tRNA (adenosine(37)-N6)-dimethylallyltransferase MiaA [Rikenellaceae bacterium]|nr:tRNA (adenosine(37)-N6)-dimethylallyltransferase MiaA [Rikenellaceae bacterium]
MSTKRLVVIVGPTGCGKTDLSIRLARHFHAPIISTDSRQFYRGLAIGTAQPTAAELAQAEHHFIASHALTDEINCGRYEVMALERLEQLFTEHDTVIAVGGSGLYVKALCEGMDDLPEANEALRAELMQQLETEGLASLCAELERLDPVYYAEVDRQNPARVLRAVEVCRQTGKPYSSLRTGSRHERPFRIVKIGVTLPREELYGRIDRRVELMMEAGLEAEARAVYPYRRLNSLQTVGYKELFAHFDGAISREEAVALIQRNSRRYAKRQLTWFRRDEAVHWFRPDEDEAIIRQVESCEN